MQAVKQIANVRFACTDKKEKLWDSGRKDGKSKIMRDVADGGHRVGE